MLKRRKASYLSIVILLFIDGCWSPVREPDLIGPFAMSSKWACGELVLNADHTFRQKLSKGCGPKKIETTGKWAVDSDKSNVMTISLEPFLARNPENDQIQSFVFTDLTVNKLRWGNVHIVIDPDAGVGYDKL